jgi:hypothetical protein
MSETKKPTDDKAKTPTNEELSEEQLEQVAGGALNAYIKLTDVVTEKVVVNEVGHGGGGGAGKIPV